MPAVIYSSTIVCANELAAIPSPLRIPPMIIVARQPQRSTRTLHMGPTERQWHCNMNNNEHGWSQIHSVTVCTQKLHLTYR